MLNGLSETENQKASLTHQPTQSIKDDPTFIQKVWRRVLKMLKPGHGFSGVEIGQAIEAAAEGMTAFDFVVAASNSDLLCGKCGLCCRKCHPILLEPTDILRISQFLGLTLADFHMRYVETDGEKFYFKHTRPCKFLKDNRCVIYPVRPTVCRYYPFTDEPGVLFFEPECNVPVEMVALKALGLLIRSKLPPKVCLAMDMLSKQVLKEAEERGFEKDSLETAMYIYARWMELLNRKTMGERRK
jgi:Fe-S-cluster containining protein